MNEFNVDRSNTRFALLAYAKYVDTLITLNKCNDETDLLSTFVLHEAGRLFQEESTDDRKKIVVIFTNEFSQGRLVILPEAAVGDVLFKELYLKTPLLEFVSNKVGGIVAFIH